MMMLKYNLVGQATCARQAGRLLMILSRGQKTYYGVAPPLTVCVIIVLGMAMVLTDRCFLVVVMMVGGSKHLNSFDLVVVTKDMWERAACDDNWLFCIL